MMRDRNGCPACGQHHADGTLICPITGVSLRFSDPRSAVGEVIGGKYRIVKVLGRGGMGAVYEAEHIELQKKVAIKVLLPESSLKPQQVERFKREARSAASIGHENIIEIFDLDTSEDGSIYIVMELLPGFDLGDLLSRNTKGLGIDRACRIGMQAALGLGSAHEHGIIHRDLKPENIFLVQKPAAEQVKIVDFGIAMMRHGEAGRLTAEGVLIGTPFYMSPEQARGERDLTPRTDIYALGTVLYEMLTGAVLFDGDTYLEILAKHQVDPPPPLLERRPGIKCPSEIEGLMRRMLAKDPRERPASMSEVAHVLAKHTSDRPAAIIPEPRAADSQKQGFAETIIAFQPGSPAPSAAARPPDPASAGGTLEWSADGGPSPTTEIRQLGRKRRWILAGVGVAILLALGGLAAAIALGVGTSPAGRGGKDSAAKAIDRDPGGSGPSGGKAGRTEVMIDIDVFPPEAAILVDGSRIEGNPVHVRVEKGTSVLLRAEADGFAPIEKEILASQDRSFSWHLEPLQKATPKGMKTVKSQPGETDQPPPKDGGGKAKKINLDKDNPYLEGT